MKIFKKIVLVVLVSFLGLISNEVKGSHLAGGNFTYTCVGPNTFVINFSVFADCGGAITPGNTEDITLISDCGDTINVQMQIQTVGGSLGLDTCSTPNTSCTGGPDYGVKEYKYSATVVLNPPCDAWNFSWSQCCRNDAVNIVNGTSTSFFISGFMNTVSAPCNNSPIFGNPFGINTICANIPSPFDLGVTDPDGDSLVFSLVSAVSTSTGGVNTNVNYSGGFTANSPVPSMTINSATGLISYGISTVGTYVISVMVCDYEYGTGVLKGCIVRDIQLLLVNCINPPNPLSSSTGNGVITNFQGVGTFIDSLTIETCVGNTFSFDLSFSDPDAGDTLALTTNIQTVLPGAITTITGLNPVILHVTWTTQYGTPPLNFFFVKVSDGHCPLVQSTTGNYSILVTPSVFVGPDQAICQGVQWASVTAVGGTSFTWSVISGSPIDTVSSSATYNTTCDTCASVQFSPQVTTTYEVMSNLITPCNVRDTITITAAPNYIATAGPDTITCSVDSLQLYAIGSIPGPFTYRWDQILHISNDTIQNPLTLPPGTTSYTVTMTSVDGCIKTATTEIRKVPPIPIPTITPINAAICAIGDSIQLNVDLGPNFTSTCVSSLFPCATGTYYRDVNAPGSIITPTSTSFPAPFGNSVKSARQQYLYKAVELQALGLQAGIITELGFFVTQLGGASTYYGYEVKMACSPKNSIPATIFVNISNQVIQPRTITLHTGWNMLPFTQPYVWDGLSNLIVEICFDNRAQATTQNTLVRTRDIPTGSGQYLASLHFTSNTINACGAPLGSSNSFSRPDTRFGFCYGNDPLAYSYTWSPNTSITDTGIIDPIAYPDTTTTYSMIIADTFGVCSDTAEIEIIVADLDAGPDTLICAGDTIQLSPTVIDGCTTGTPIPFWYSSNGVGWISTAGIVPTVSVTTTTKFYIQYTNFCGCSILDSVMVYVNEMAPPRVTITEPSSCAMSDGEILVQDSGGLAPFLYSADGGATFHVDSVFTNIAFGTSDMQYMDSLGCLSPIRTEIINYSFLIDSVTTVTPLCFGDSTGELSIYVSGGYTPYSYSIDNGTTWTSNNVITGLLSGTYIVMATDSTLCLTEPDTVTISSNTQLILDSVQVTDLNCYQDSSGTITVFGHGGVTNYTYSIDGGLTYQSASLFTGLQAGTYNVIIKDSSGCVTAPFTQIVNDAIPFIPVLTITNDSCFNACGGSAITNVTGGTMPYTYNWRKGTNSIGVNSPSLSGLCAGVDYELTVIDSHFCQAILPFMVSHPNELIATSVVVNNSCFGVDDGTITVSGTGGIPPYNYSIDNGVTFSNNPLFTGLVAGTYNIMIADSGLRCNASTTAIILAPNAITTTTNITSKTICISGCTPLIASATGGTGSTFSYIWSNGFDSSNAQTACPTQTTIYSVYAVDSRGCTSPAVLITLDLHDSLEVNAGIDQDLCPSETAQLNASGTGGNGQINYQWSPVNGLSGGFISNPTAKPSSSTLYTVRVTDNCETPAAYDSVWVNIHPNPTMGFHAQDTTLGCEPFNITLVNTSSPIQFAEWTIGEDVTAHGFQVDITDLMEGVYNVKLRVISPEGCESEIIQNKFITVYPLPKAKFTMDPKKTTVYNTVVQFTDKSRGNIQTWEWNFSDLDVSTDANPTYKFPADTGTFPISLTVTSTESCVDDVTETLRIGEEFNIFVPNSFTPNGDNHNDVFAPRAVGVDPTGYSLMIFDRWGGLIFESIDLNQPWDGRIQGTTEMAPNGVYVWKIEAHDTTDDSDAHTYNGTINLIR